jgi:hypothetical protein
VTTFVKPVVKSTVSLQARRHTEISLRYKGEVYLIKLLKASPCLVCSALGFVTLCAFGV